MTPAPNLIDQILDHAANPSDRSCNWCKHPDKRVKVARLCAHCNRLRSALSLWEKRLTTFNPPSETPIETIKREELDYNVRVARQMVELAKAEGEDYARIADDVSGLDLETELRNISKRCLKQDLFFGDAGILGQGFDARQRRLLYYLLQKMSTEDRRRRRRSIAEGRVGRNEDLVQ